MYYLLITFTYKTTDFYADYENIQHGIRLYFYNTEQECESQFEIAKKIILKEYNTTGKEAYRVSGQYFVELDEHDIKREINIVSTTKDIN